MIYLDNAATTYPKPFQVCNAVYDALQNSASLGRSSHQLAQRASELAFQCRAAAAKLFDAAPEQVVFTSNATHGLNIAIKSIVHPGDNVIISGFEHNAVVRPLKHLGANIKIAGRRVFQPELLLNDLKDTLSSDIKAVICTHVSNVFGYILPITEISQLCRENSIPFILDASQSAGCLPISLNQLGAAFIAMPGHKGLLGPQGTGLLLCSRCPAPLIEGGTGSLSQSYEMPEFLPDCAEAGTHNIPGIAGLLEGIRYVSGEGMSYIFAHEKELIKLLYHSLCHIPSAAAFYSEAYQSGVLSFQMKGEDCEVFAQKMSEHGIALRAGLHCAPLAHESAGTIKEGTIRISVSPMNTKSDILDFCHIAETMVRSPKY